MLEVRLLGRFDVRVDGQPVELPLRAAQSMLAYLVLNAGTAQRREKVAGLLWPDMPDAKARDNLRHTLWVIRKALGSRDYLLADDFTVSFNTTLDYWLDTALLERKTTGEESADDLIAIASTCGGELLPGFYDDWVVPERERLQAVFERKMALLLDKLVAAQRWPEVLDWGERWLALGDVPEPAYRALLLAYGARGDMAKVASLYQRCTDELREQLGVEPSAETRALYEGLVKGAKAPLRTASVQPSGTVTFLFTDIAGSTRLLDKLREQYATVLAEHHAILRTAIQKWNGREVDTQGDAFFVTFARALDAVQCAADAQCALAAHAWPQSEAVRVRMGLHTGEPLIASTGYVGMDVHRAARIGDAGHGGQVLLSQTTRELVRHDLPPGVTIRDLGEHRLKDMKYPTPLYQLVIDGLPAEFPPLKTKFTGTEAPTPGEAPFKGLQYFDERDAELFFGREVLTAKLVKRLRDRQFLSVIIGASGSGKSSLVRAGLIPALKKGEALLDGTQPPEGSAAWRIYILTPTAHPLEALASELTRDSESVTATATLIDDLTKDPRSLHLYLSRRIASRDSSPGSHHTLLVIDQFEELFTLCRDEFEREAFVDNLLTTISPAAFTPQTAGRAFGGEGGSDGRVTLVITLRADFYAHLAQYPELRDAVAQQQEYIGPMTAEELRRAMEEPVKRGHWEFEPGLVDLILRDVGEEPGALPLLSHALLETWKRRAGHTLTLQGYAEAGGVRGAIAHTAESVYQDFSPKDQTVMRNVLLRLTEFGEGTEDTRRRASFAELISQAEDRDEVRAVLNRLAEARLVTLSEESAEVAHEALIREWPRLRDWLAQDREGILLHRHLTEAAQEWAHLDRDAGSVYRGARLAQANEWARTNPNGLNVLEQAFLAASQEQEQREASEREAQRQRELEAARKLAETEKQRAEEQAQAANRLRTRNRALAVAGALVTVAAIAAILFGGQANANATRADQNAQQAQVNEAAAQANADTAQQAKVDADTQRDAARKSEANALTQQRIAASRELAASALNQIDVDPERAIWIAQQAVKTTYAVDQTVLPEAASALHRAVQASLVEYQLSGQVPPMNAIDLSPDGSRIAIGSANNLTKIYDAKTGQELLTLKGHQPIINQAGLLVGGVVDVRFSPDGTHIATAGEDNTARIWDAATGQQLFVLKGTGNRVNGVAYNADGTRLATAGGDGAVIIWDVKSGKPLTTLVVMDEVHPSGVSQGVQRAIFSPDGKYIATGSSDDTVRVWDVAIGKPLWQVSDFPSYGLAFSPDSQLLAGASHFMTTVKIWNVATGQEERSFSKQAGWITDVAFSSDGKRIASASSDHTVKIWDPHTGQVLQTLTANDSWVLSARFSADGKQLVTAGLDGTAKLWDLETGRPLFTLSNQFDPADRVVFSAIQFSPDGMRLAVQSSGPGANGVQVWSVSQGKKGKLLQTLPGSPFGFYAFQWSMDGTRLATMDPWIDDGTLIHIWDMTSLDPLPHEVLSATIESRPGGKWAGAFAATLSRVAFSKDDGSIEVTDLKTGRLLRTSPSSNPPIVNQIALSPDGDQALTLDDPATARVVDLATGQTQFKLARSNSFLNSMVYSPDGKRIATLSSDGTAKVWDAATGQELFTLFARASSNSVVTFNGDGTRLATGTQDGSVSVWDARTGRFLFDLLGHKSGIRGITFSPDGSTIATASEDGTVRVWSTLQRNEIGAWAGDLTTTNADATRLVTYQQGGGLTVQTWDTTKDSPFAQSRLFLSVTLPIGDILLHTVRVSPDWRYLTTSLDDATVQVWEAVSGKQLVSFIAHDIDAVGATFSPDGRRLLTNSNDGTAKVWDIASAIQTGTPPVHELFTLSGHGFAVNQAVYSPDGTRIATGRSRDGVINVWDASTGQELMALSGHTFSIFALVYSPDGKRIGSGSRDLTAKIWDAETGKELLTLRGHSGPVIGVAFSRDGKLIATASSDGTTKVWDGVTGDELLTFSTPATTGAITFSPDGTRLLVDEGRDGVHEYVLGIEDLMALARSRVTRTLTTEECQKYLHLEQCPQ